MKAEHAFRGGYTSVKDAVRILKVGRKEVFLTLSHPPGETQVDFGLSMVFLVGVETDVVLSGSCAPFASGFVPGSTCVRGVARVSETTDVSRAAGGAWGRAWVASDFGNLQPPRG